jgi:hypothetical protein
MYKYINIHGPNGALVTYIAQITILEVIQILYYLLLQQ